MAKTAGELKGDILSAHKLAVAIDGLFAIAKENKTVAQHLLSLETATRVFSRSAPSIAIGVQLSIPEAQIANKICEFASTAWTRITE